MPELTKTPQKKLVQKKRSKIQHALDASIEKTKPKRMGSERPDQKSPKKLRRVPIIKNSFSLRVNKKKEKRNGSKKSKLSESDNEVSSIREYSEEQGRRAFNFNPSSNCKSITAVSKSESKYVEETKSTNSSMKISNLRTAKNDHK